MVSEVILQMNNRDCTVSAAMINAYYLTTKNDYIDLFLPFVIEVLPDLYNSPVDFQHIKSQLRDRFAISLLDNVLKLILQNRLTTEPNDYLSQAYNRLQVRTRKQIDHTKFNQELFMLRNKHDILMQKYKNFIESTYPEIENFTIEDAEKQIIDYMSEYNHLFEINKDSSTKHRVAYFMESLKAKKDQNDYKDMEEIIKGCIITKTISLMNIENPSQLFDKISFYLDTTLLFNLLGYGGKEEQVTVKQLCDLLLDLGATLKCFAHNVRELNGILEAFKKHYNNNTLDESFRMQYLILNFNNITISVEQELMQSNLATLNITVEEKPNFHDYQSNIGWEELKLELLSKSKYKENSLNNDIESAAAIYRLRGSEKPLTLQIENCEACFVSSNDWLVNNINYHFRTKDKRDMFQPLISDMDLTAIAWLKSGNKTSDLISLKIIQHSMSLFTLSKEGWDEFDNILQKYQTENLDLDTEQKLISLKFSTYTEKSLTILSDGDNTRISSLEIPDIIEQNKRLQFADQYYEAKELKKNIVDYKKLQERKSARFAHNCVFGLRFVPWFIFIICMLALIYDFYNSATNNVLFPAYVVFGTLSGVITAIGFLKTGKKIVSCIEQKIFVSHLKRAEDELINLHNENEISY